MCRTEAPCLSLLENLVLSMIHLYTGMVQRRCERNLLKQRMGLLHWTFDSSYCCLCPSGLVFLCQAAFPVLTCSCLKTSRVPTLNNNHPIGTSACLWLRARACACVLCRCESLTSKSDSYSRVISENTQLWQCFAVAVAVERRPCFSGFSFFSLQLMFCQYFVMSLFLCFGVFVFFGWTRIKPLILKQFYDNRFQKGIWGALCYFIIIFW